MFRCVYWNELNKVVLQDAKKLFIYLSAFNDSNEVFILLYTRQVRNK